MYTFGLGKGGQLGHPPLEDQSFPNELFPRLVFALKDSKVSSFSSLSMQEMI